MPRIGILFNIDELGGGLYGYTAYKIFFGAVDTRKLAGCSFSDGDTNGGSGPEYCISIDAPYASTISEVINIMSQVDAPGLLPGTSRFLEDASVRRESLVFAGRINFSGNLENCNTNWIVEAWQLCQPKHLSSKPSSRQSAPTNGLTEKQVPRTSNQLGPVQWQIGDIIENRWEIKGNLKGGLGTVYIGYDRVTGDTFAAKTFRDDVFANNPEIAKRFVREATNWMNLGIHQHVTQAKSIESIGGKPFLFLEYVSGGDLSTWIGTPRLTEDLPQVLRFAVQFCDGMIYALLKGISVHRDIKPENCLVTENNMLKVTDFGLAKSFDDVDPEPSMKAVAEKNKQVRWWDKFFQKKILTPSRNLQKQTTASPLTRAGAIAGTYTHMAPEQFDDAKTVDVRADVYSFGILLYQMLTGELPFMAESLHEFENIHKNVRPPHLNLPSNVPPPLVSHLDSIVQTCLAKKPAERFQDFDEIRQVLANIYKDLTGQALQPPLAGPELDLSRINDIGLGLINLGKPNEGLSQFDNAIHLYSKLDEASKNSTILALIWNNKGLALSRLERFEEAFQCFLHATEIADSYSHAWNNKGSALMYLGHDEEALECFERAIKLDPYYAMAINNKGVVLRKMGRPDALGCFTLAIHYNPHCAEAWFNKGLSLGKAGNIQDAIFHLEQAKKLGFQQAAQLIEKIQNG